MEYKHVLKILMRMRRNNAMALVRKVDFPRELTLPWAEIL